MLIGNIAVPSEPDRSQSWVWWFMLIILVLHTLQQEDYHEFEGQSVYIVRPSLKFKSLLNKEDKIKYTLYTMSFIFLSLVRYTPPNLK